MASKKWQILNGICIGCGGSSEVECVCVYAFYGTSIELLPILDIVVEGHGCSYGCDTSVPRYYVTRVVALVELSVFIQYVI